MFFVAAKLFWIVAAPASLACLLAVLALAARLAGRRRLAMAALWASASILIVAGATPLGPWAGSLLETRYPARPPLPAEIAGIVVLGGALDTDRSIAWDMPVIAGEGERIFGLVELGRRFPGAPIIYAGGYGGLGTVEKVEAAFARTLLEQIGFDADRVRFDDQPRNTIENEARARELAGDIASRPWLLVTGAMHMPRAVGVFRGAGWSIIPWPVGPATLSPDGPWQPLAPGETLMVSTQAAREWIGLLAYYLAGNTESLLPD
ncbi:YdcF family protein [Oleomonas cavernae]|nr:YdcF family protein [Oleomonas cavernae]